MVSGSVPRCQTWQVLFGDSSDVYQYGGSDCEVVTWLLSADASPSPPSVWVLALAERLPPLQQVEVGDGMSLVHGCSLPLKQQGARPSGEQGL